MSDFLQEMFLKHRSILDEKFSSLKRRNMYLSEKDFFNELIIFFKDYSNEWNNLHSEELFLSVYSLLLDVFSKRVFSGNSYSVSVKSEFMKIYPFLLKNHTVDFKDIFSVLINYLSIFLSNSYFKKDEWLQKTLDLIRLKESAGAFKKSALVSAWTNGMANARSASLECIPQLSDECFSLIFGFSCSDNDKKAFSEFLSESPWNHPSAFGKTAKKEIVFRRFGKAKGLDGGKFTGNPVPFIHQDRIYVYDGENYFRFHSDIFGTMIEAAEKVTSSPSASGRFQWRNGRLSIEGISADIPEFPTSRTGMTCSEDTAVFFSAYSFSLLIAGVRKYA